MHLAILWPPKTAGRAESSTEEDCTTTPLRGHRSTPKCAKPNAGHINKKVACFVLCASYHYCRFPDRRLKWGVIRVFRAVRRKFAQIKGRTTPVRMVPEPSRYDQSSNYAPCQTAVCPLFGASTRESGRGSVGFVWKHSWEVESPYPSSIASPFR
jgi:hypothetical protein